MSAVWTTTTSPAWSAKIEMNSSGRLPRADWRTPGLARPETVPELVGARADDPGEPGEGDRRDDEHRRVGRPAEAQDGGRDRRPDRHDEQRQRGPAEHLGDRRDGRRGGGHGFDDTGVGGARTARRRRRSTASALPSGHAHEPARRRDESVPPPARAQPGRLVPVGRGGARPGQDGGQADLPVDRLRRLPLVPRHGARVVRGPGRPPPSSTATSCRSRSIARNAPTSTRSTWPRSRR